ncbi:MAG: 3-hydroxyacyl-CoA dehydrogenase NAD-binding domain-containing protein [Candidatus Hodarchaeota archaeon]
MEIKKIAIVGAGLMGAGIAYVSALKGFEVGLNDMNEELVNKGMQRIRNDVMGGIDRGKMKPADGMKLIQAIKGSADLAECVQDADLVIEAIFEKMEVKKAMFEKLDRLAPPHAILASNTSTLSISEIASATERPEKVLGMHFFSPVPAMPLLELVAGKETSGEALEKAKEVGNILGKKLIISKDGPGFIVNRVLGPTLGEFNKIYEARLAPIDLIEKAAVKDGLFPVGPFTLLDFVGLDVALQAGKTLERAFGETYAVSPMLQKAVDMGHLGSKVGKGIQDLAEDFEPKISTDEIMDRVIAVAVNEAAKCVHEEDITSVQDVDIGMKLGTNWSDGPFQLADKIGTSKIVGRLKSLQAEHGDFYKPSELLIQQGDKKFY